MAQLKCSLKQLALQNIRTYIQSGNIIFESNEYEEDLQKKMQDKINEDFGIFTTVVIRTAEELRQIVRQCPFSEQKKLSKQALHVRGSVYMSLYCQPHLQLPIVRSIYLLQIQRNLL